MEEAFIFFCTSHVVATLIPDDAFDGIFQTGMYHSVEKYGRERGMLRINRSGRHVGQGTAYAVFPVPGQREHVLVRQFEVHVLCFSGYAAFTAVVVDFDGQCVLACLDQTARYGVMALYVVACAVGDLLAVPIDDVFIVDDAGIQLQVFTCPFGWNVDLLAEPHHSVEIGESFAFPISREFHLLPVVVIQVTANPALLYILEAFVHFAEFGFPLCLFFSVFGHDLVAVEAQCFQLSDFLLITHDLFERFGRGPCFGRCPSPSAVDDPDRYVQFSVQFAGIKVSHGRKLRNRGR